LAEATTGDVARTGDQPLLERVVAACVEEQQRDPSQTLGLLQQALDIHRLKPQVARDLEFDAGGQQPVSPAYLQGMASI